MSEIDPRFIHHGFWIDWSKGRVLGATLTTNSIAGNIVIALIAVLVSLATNHLWNLILFAVHQLRAMRPHRSVIFQQQQAIIRTLPIPFLLFTDMTKIAWAWRKIAPTRSLTRMLAIGLMALLFGHAAIVASVFSSYMVEVSNVHVLVSDVRCGIDIDWKYLSRKAPDWVTPTIRASQSYADSCYDTAVEPSVCNVFATPRVALSQTNVSCPFDSTELCIGSNPTSIVLDSGLIDSDSILGINAHPADRIFFRKRTTYTPIQVEGHYSVLNHSQVAAFYRQRTVLPGEQVYSFNYGQTEHTAVLPGLNSTTYWSTSLSNLLLSYTAWADMSYASHTSDTSFIVNRELYRSDADTGVVFVYGNNIQSSVPIDDPVFASHLPLYCDSDTLHNCSTTPDPNRPVTLYSADHPAGVVAALSQYQACLSDHSGKPTECTDLTSLLLGRIPDLLPSASEAQGIILKFLSSLTYLYDLDYIQYVDNDASALKASRANMGGFQLGLPSDQWVTESIRWESTLWAALQIATAYHTTGFGGQSPGYVLPRTKAEFDFCRSQKVVKPGGFANINVFGVALSVCLSLILICTDIFALRLALLLSRTRWFSFPRVQKWIQDGVLQYQRQANQAEDTRSWERIDKEVPVCYGTRNLSDPDGADDHVVSYTVDSSPDHTSRNPEQERQGCFTSWVRSRISPRTAPAVGSEGSELTFSNTLDEKKPDKSTARVAHDEVFVLDSTT